MRTLGLVTLQAVADWHAGMTTIVINAQSPREGGSLVVLQELLQALQRQRPGWHWHVLTNAIALPQLPALPGVHYHLAGANSLRAWGINWSYEVSLPALLAGTGADLLFSQTNFLPLRPLSCPSLLLMQQAGYFSPVFRTLALDSRPGPLRRFAWYLRERWVRNSLARASLVTVQTEALRQAIIAEGAIDPARIRVIPHGCGLVKPGTHLPLPPEDAAQAVRIGYITKYGVQKNFAVLFRALALLQQQGIACTLVLTLDPAAGTTAGVLAQAQALGVARCMENHGDVSADAVRALYRSLHVFAFPSLCESFGFPLVEAMACGLPLVVSATASNLEVGGNAALAFAPDDAAALATLVAQLSTDAELYRRQAEASLARAACFDWNVAAAATVSLMEALLAPEKAN